MLVTIPPHLSVSSFMGYLKSKSSLMIFDKHANLKYKYGNRHFWCRGYYVDTVGRYEATSGITDIFGTPKVNDSNVKAMITSIGMG